VAVTAIQQVMFEEWLIAAMRSMVWIVLVLMGELFDMVMEEW
jgi:hypothetical protein